MSTICEGDLVRLKIGGPEMAVLAVIQDYAFPDGAGTGVFCVSESNNLLFEQVYPPDVIEVVVAEGGFDEDGFICLESFNDL